MTYFLLPAGEQEGRVRLAALELLDRQFAGKALDVGAQPVGQAAGVEGVLPRPARVPAMRDWLAAWTPLLHRE
jgi:hypothetical protein